MLVGARCGLQLKLGTAASGTAFHGGGHRTENIHPPMMRVREGRRLRQESLRQIGGRGLGAQQRHVVVWRLGGFVPFGGGGEARIPFTEQGAQQRVVGLMCLDQYFARVFGAAGTSRDLSDELRKTLARAEVDAEETLIGIQDGSERDLGEVMTLRQHLRADQNRVLAALRLVEQLLQRAFASGAVAVDAGDGVIRKTFAQHLLAALRAVAERSQLIAVTGWAVRLRLMLGAAVVAAQASLRGGIDQMRVAAPAARDPAAIVAEQRLRIAAAIQE